MRRSTAVTASTGEVTRRRRRRHGWIGWRRRKPGSYDAFISYSHSSDYELATAVQRALHRFAKPWHRLRAVRVFRDDASLSADPGLWTSIEAGLRASRWLVILASRQAAASPWVAREAAWWVEHKEVGTVLVAVTDGEIEWDNDRGDFNWDRTNALPPSLCGVFQEEPRYIDLRAVRSAGSLSLDDAGFREAVADLAAPLHGLPKDALTGEDVRQHRRTLRLAWTVAALLVVLAAGAAASALFALDQRDQARAERDAATSRQLAAESSLLRDDRLDRALLLGVEAVNVDPTVEARSALLNAVQHHPEALSLLHQGDAKISSVVASPDGTVVAAASGEEIVLWDVRRRQRQREPMRHGAAVGALAFGPDGTTLLSGGDDGRVVYWDTSTGAATGESLSVDGPVLKLAVGAGPTMAVLVDELGVVLWDFETGRRLGPLDAARELASVGAGVGAVEPDLTEQIVTLALSPDGRTLATGGDINTNTIEFWDLETRQAAGPTITIPVGDYGQAALAFSVDGTLLASGGGGQGGINVWDVKGRELRTSLPGHRGPVTSLAFGPDGRLASAGVDRTISVWNVEEGTSRLGPWPAQGVAESVLFLPHSPWLVSASDEGVVALWETDGLENLPFSTPLASGASTAEDYLAFSPDGRLLASANFDHVTLWDVANPSVEGRVLVPSEDNAVEDVVFLRQGSILATAVDDGTVVLWDTARRARVGEELTHGSSVRALAVPGDDDLRLASAGDDGSIRLWDVSTGASGSAMRQDGPVSALAFSPDGRILAAAGALGEVILWDVGSGRRRGASLDHGADVLAVAFSPDGETLASAGVDGRVVLWELASRRPLGDLPAGRGDAVQDVTFSPDGQTVATAGGPSVILWDAATRREVGRPLGGVRDTAVSVAYSPTGRHLAWGSLSIEPSNDLLVLWDPREESWKKQACLRAGRNLTSSEWSRFLGGARAYAKTCPSSMMASGDALTRCRPADGDGRSIAEGLKDGRAALEKPFSVELVPPVRGFRRVVAGVVEGTSDVAVWASGGQGVIDAVDDNARKHSDWGAAIRAGDELRLLIANRPETRAVVQCVRP